tara:strand:+ start:190 stop:630 length:441 start_codon:yes stop_codon:yes gene_type:complete
MKIILTSVLFLMASNFAYAAKSGNSDSMSLMKRQPDSIMTVTSINTGTDKTTITAKGKMGEYGKVYVTYNLSLNADRTGGFVDGSGRGVVDADTVAAGFFKGIWRREGSTIVMHNVVNLADGSQNFDIITFDARRDTLKHEVYILR